MIQQFMVVTYVHILMSMKTKLKVLKFKVLAISKFFNMDDIYAQRFALYFKFKWTEKGKNEESKKKHFVQKQQFTILMCCNDFDVF